MKKIILFILILLFLSCKSKDNAVKIYTRKVNPHKLNKYPNPYRYNPWKN